MYELTIQTEFCAAHAITISGTREPLHGHNWRVTITIEGPTLDTDGLLLDFHELEANLKKIIAPLNNANLNETPPFNQLNPTAEHVAKHIANSLAASLPQNVTLQRATVTEAPNCQATYLP